MSLRYHTLADGEWIRPVRNGFRERCCDCGLVHIVDYRVTDGVLEFRVRRDQRATTKARRNGAVKLK